MNPPIPYIIAVSYTHLDVYKRQLVNLDKSNAEQQLNKFMKDMNPVAFESVSYTHLDVYKRQLLHIEVTGETLQRILFKAISNA